MKYTQNTLHVIPCGSIGRLERRCASAQFAIASALFLLAPITAIALALIFCRLLRGGEPGAASYLYAVRAVRRGSELYAGVVETSAPLMGGLSTAAVILSGLAGVSDSVVFALSAVGVVACTGTPSDAVLRLAPGGKADRDRGAPICPVLGSGHEQRIRAARAYLPVGFRPLGPRCGGTCAACGAGMDDRTGRGVGCPSGLSSHRSRASSVAGSRWRCTSRPAAARRPAAAGVKAIPAGFAVGHPLRARILNQGTVVLV